MQVVHLFFCVLISVALSGYQPTVGLESHKSSPGGNHISTSLDHGTATDKLPIRLTTGRKNRYTWKISSYSTLNQVDVDHAFYRATKLWSKVAQIDFVQEKEGSSMDIDIKFFTFSAHDEMCNVSLTGNNFAHMVRRHGRVEIHIHVFSLKMRINANLAAVAAHQLGLVLGLNHSSDPTSIMYNGSKQYSFLNENDVQVIQDIYGAKTSPTNNECRNKARTHRIGRRMCATVFKQRLCNGPQLDIEHNNVTNHMNSDWLYEISSAEIDPECTLRLCRLPMLKGNCTNVFGGANGLNLYWLSPHYENYVASLTCVCGNIDSNLLYGRDQCSDRITDLPNADLPNDLPNGQKICAAVYKEDKCSGARMNIENGYRSEKLEYDWYAVISSAQVAPMCALKLCYRESFDSESCTDLTGGMDGIINYRQLPEVYSGNVKSMSCSCTIGDGNDEDSERITVAPTVRTSRPFLSTTTTTRPSCPTRPSHYMPNGYQKLCAVVYEEPNCRGSNMYLKKAYTNSFLTFPWSLEISSVQVNQGCQLKVCKQEYYSEPCLNLAAETGGTDFTQMPAGFDNAVRSLACSCEVEEDATRTTTTISPEGENIICPYGIPRYMPDGTSPMCAAIYTDKNCKGRRLPLPVFDRTLVLNDTWRNLVSSAEVNPFCTLEVCKTSYLESCKNFTSSTSIGLYYNVMPLWYDNTITSLKCSCADTSLVSTTITTNNQCQTRMPPGQEGLCAIAYKDKDCNGERLEITSGNITNQLNFEWFDEISSLQIRDGCTFHACFLTMFGECTIFHSGGYNELPRFYDNSIRSLSCTCNSVQPSTTSFATTTLVNTTVAVTTTTTTTQDQESSSTPKPRFFIGPPPPVFIPNTNHPTCAVFTTGLLQLNSQLAWMKKEVVNKTLASLAQGSFIYGIAAPNCNVYYCPRPNFGGICKNLGPGQHTNIWNANRFSIGSYICDCQYNR